MKLASWNVNSIRQRLADVTDWLNAHEPDVLALQEIKTEASKFPLAEIEATGYRCVLDGQKAYNGVALISREEAADVATGIPACLSKAIRPLKVHRTTHNVESYALKNQLVRTSPSRSALVGGGTRRNSSRSGFRR